MRNLRLLAFVAPVFFLPLACEDSSGSSSGATFNPEAGPGFEAGPSPEAGVPETGVDAAPPAPLGVTVTVTDGTQPKNNARVILHDAAGLVIGEKTTDATGKVTLPTAPSMVTVLLARGSGAGSSVEPVTFAGVADGDKLVVAAVPNVQVDPVIVGQYSVAFSNAGIDVSSATYFTANVGAGCGNGGGAQPVTVDVYESCLATKNAVLAQASNNAGLLGFAFAKDLGKPAAGPPLGVVNVGPLAVSAPGSTKLAATNVPQTVNTYGQLYALANSAAFEMTDYGGILENGGADFKTPTGFAEAYQARVSFDKYNAQSTSTKIFVRREAVPANSVLTDVSFTTALPFVNDAPLTTPAPGRPEVTFATEGALTAADGGVATFRWSNSLAETSGAWTFVFPPSTTTIKVPALPADAAAFVPASNVSIDEVFFIEATQVPGYKELKLLPVQPNVGVDLLNTAKPLPLPGTVRVSRWYPGVPG